MNGSGALTQSGGTNSVSTLSVGTNRGSSGTYNLSGRGLLTAADEYMGYNGGSGAIMQSGGTHAVSGGIYIGFDLLSGGTYNLCGSGLLTASAEYLGYFGSGSFTQSGGTNLLSSGIVFGHYPGTSGTYDLNGGLLSLSSLGMTSGSGAATFNFGGGTLGANSALGWSSSLAMTLTGIGGNATVDTTGGNITLTGNLSGPGGLNKVGAGTLFLTGSNSYSGSTIVSGGTLSIAQIGLSDSAAVSIASGAMMNLGFTGTDVIGSLYLNGALQDGGLFGQATPRAISAELASCGSCTVTYESSAASQFDGKIVGTENSLVVNSPNGSLTLTGVNTYGGGTTVLAGTLIGENRAAIEDGMSLTVGADLSAFGGVISAQDSASAVAPVAVPEPGTLAFLAAAVCAIAIAFALSRRARCCKQLHARPHIRLRRW